MHSLLAFLIRLLEGMFIAGIAGSLVVVLLTLVEDVRAITEDGEEEPIVRLRTKDSTSKSTLTSGSLAP